MKKISLILLLIIYTNSYAQITTDRPDQTESSSTVGKKNLQIESGYLASFEEKSKTYLTPSTLFRYGISKSIEIRLVNQFENATIDNKKITGISDLELGAKISLLKKGNTEAAFISHLVLPTGSKSLTLNKFGVINKLAISHSITQTINLGYNLGYNYTDTKNGDITYSIALGIPINSKVGIYVEPYGSIENLKNHISNADAGFTYLINPNLQADFSFGLGINQTMNYLSVGISWLISHK